MMSLQEFIKNLNEKDPSKKQEVNQKYMARLLLLGIIYYSKEYGEWSIVLGRGNVQKAHLPVTNFTTV